MPHFDKFTVYRNENFKLKYCYTCVVYRPARSSHCGVCDACVEMIDHHCPWLGTCVGRRTYLSFFLFINATSLFAVLASAMTTAEILVRIVEHDGDWWERVVGLLTSNPLFLLTYPACTFSFIFVVYLTFFHHKLLRLG